MRYRAQVWVGRHGARGDYRRATGRLASHYLVESVIEEKFGVATRARATLPHGFQGGALRGKNEIVTKLSSGNARRTQALALTFSGFQIVLSISAPDQT